MESLAALYKNHIVTLQERTRDVLARFQMDALLIHSGELVNVFLDDHPYPFKVNPQFKAWVPVTQVPNCWLLVDGVNKPKLWFYLPVEYWHNVEPLPTSFWTEEIDVIARGDEQDERYDAQGLNGCILQTTGLLPCSAPKDDAAP